MNVHQPLPPFDDDDEPGIFEVEDPATEVFLDAEADVAPGRVVSNEAVTR